MRYLKSNCESGQRPATVVAGLNETPFSSLEPGAHYFCTEITLRPLKGLETLVSYIW